MARLWFVIMLVITQNVFADNEVLNQSCDVCIRSGGTWCLKKSKQGNCVIIDTDDACPDGEVAQLPNSLDKTTDGDLFRPMYAERTLYIKDSYHRKMAISYTSAVKKNVTIHFLNTSDPKLDVHVGETYCNATQCTVDVLARATRDFCSFFEFIDVGVRVEGLPDEAHVRYRVPCSCDCTNKTETNSKKCSGHGNYTCGVCTCDTEWTGDTCSDSCTRGDQTQEEECMNIKDDKEVICSGNGKCVCGKCKCFENKVGSQYFDQPNHCADVCMQSMECHDCLRSGVLGYCEHCSSQDVSVVARNETIAKTLKDDMNRKVWVHCSENMDGCNYDYYAMRDEDGISVMINENCNTVVTQAYTGTQVPLIVGILGLIAVVATVGGILLWKHMSSLPPLPTTDPGYANIDAEDCTGENPLYIPPTSSFKNPTYGKW